MAALSIQVPYPVFYDRDGQPLDGGRIYIGESNLDPVTNPIATYYDDALTIPAAQPLITSAGYIYRNGTPAQVYVDAVNFSILVNDSKNLLVYSFPNGTGISPSAADITYNEGDTGAVDRTVQSRLADYISPMDFGAVADGVIDDRAAFAYCDDVGSFTVPRGDYLIDSSITFTNHVTMTDGAKLIVPAGVTVTFDGGFDAPVSQVFDVESPGEIVFNWTKTATGYPEWWGAIPGGADCLDAIHSCIAACKTTFLHPGDYFVSNTVKLDSSHRWIIGSGSQYSNTTNEVTRLLVSNGSNYVLQIGPDSNPGTINDFQKQNVVRNLFVGRSVAPVIASDCAGVNCQFTLYAELHDVKSAENMVGFRFYGNVYLKCYDCASVRATAGTGPGTDSWYGFYYDGTASIGAAGGNASVYTNYCSAGCNIPALQTGVSYGFYVNDGFTDLFFESVETVSCNVGMYVEGNAPSGAVPSNTDLQIKNPIHDAFYGVGTYFKNINKYGSASLIGGYHGANAAATYSILVEDCECAVMIVGGQFPMYGATTTTPIGISGSKGVVVDRTQILDATAYGVVLVDSDNCDIRPIVKNNLNPLAQGGVTMTGSERNTIAPIVYGAAGYVEYGINAGGSANNYNEFNCTGIDSATVGTSADKLIINGSQITVTGLSGTNLVSGVMA